MAFRIVHNDRHKDTEYILSVKKLRKNKVPNIKRTFGNAKNCNKAHLWSGEWMARLGYLGAV